MSSSPEVNPYQAPASPNSSVAWQSSIGSQGDAGVTARIVELLRQTQPWVRLLSVVGYILSALLMVGAAAGFLFGVTGGGVGGPVIAVTYGILAALYFAPALFLGRYATSIARLR